MKRLEVSGAVRPMYGSLGVKLLTEIPPPRPLISANKHILHQEIREWKLGLWRKHILYYGSTSVFVCLIMLSNEVHHVSACYVSQNFPTDTDYTRRMMDEQPNVSRRPINDPALRPHV